MTVTVIATTRITTGEEEALNAYVEGVGPLVAQAGGVLVARYQSLDNAAGGAGPVFISIIDYPDEAAVDLVFSSDIYRSLQPARDRAFSRYEITLTRKV